MVRSRVHDDLMGLTNFGRNLVNDFFTIAERDRVDVHIQLR